MAADNQEQQQQQAGHPWFSMILNFILIWMISNFVISHFFSSNSSTPSTSNNNQKDEKSTARRALKCAWERGQEYSMVVLLFSNCSNNETPDESPYRLTPMVEKHFDRLSYQEDDPEKEITFDVDLTDVTLNNCTVSANITMRGTRMKEKLWATTTARLAFFKKEKKVRTHNLFDDDNTNSTKEDNATSVTSLLWQPRLTLNPVCDTMALDLSQIPQNLHSYIHTVDEYQYTPMFYVNNFWVFRNHLVTLNQSTPQPQNLTLHYYPMTMFKFMMYAQFEHGLNWQESLGTATERDSEETRRMFYETNPILLAVTMVVSLLHTVFEYLAFKNDIKFWRETKDYHGLSLRAVALNCYFQTIIFLYLWDGDETSMMVYIPCFIGVVIEYWKLRKVVRVTRDPTTHKIHFSFQIAEGDVTKGYDRIATKYLLYALAPLLVGYTFYSMVYHTHKGWYSFVIQTQVRFIYMFGFIMMTPQLFINYQLKSVAHLPWKTFVYKSLNTFIDDLFAFIIKMPTMHRLACFRDDIVFFILLYQRWIYPVDRKRQNEYGQSGLTQDEQVSPDAKKNQ